MLRAAEHGWRVFATGFCFAWFGIGGLVLRVFVFPALSVVLRGQPERQRVCKNVVHHVFRLFVWLMAKVGVIRYEIRGAGRLRRQGLLIVANHPSLIDVVLLISQVRQADCVVKGALLRNPFTRGPLRATGYVCNDSGVGMVDACIDSLRAGNNLVIFPEGTRTVPGESLRLQRGAANIAVRGGFPLTPVVIRCEPPTLAKGEKWYRVPPSRPRFVLEVHEDIPLSRWVAEDVEPTHAVRQATQSLTDYFCREIRREGA